MVNQNENVPRGTIENEKLEIRVNVTTTVQKLMRAAIDLERLDYINKEESENIKQIAKSVMEMYMNKKLGIS